jgi:hypothetical protein
MNIDAPCLEFLNLLERSESQLLVWGLVDGSFSSDEITERCTRFLDEHNLWDQFEDEQKFLESLEDTGLLFCFRDGMRIRYRTRMGETLRLLARLRQLFPKHLQGTDRRWQIANPLVGDFRFMLRPRIVPRRTLSAQQVRSRIEESTQLSDLQREVLNHILTLPDGSSISLANFQARATENIFSKVKGNRSSGTIVCAGTGSGKTLAFYLPTFLHIAQSIDKNDWTRCIAIYPRNELLKDQLSEAYNQARKLDSVLSSHGKRKLTIGTLFGDTPENEVYFEYEKPPSGWTKVNDGNICPLLTCPTRSCHGQMIWRNQDRKNKIHRLYCTRCNAMTENDELILTRQRVKSTPPDILFTTTEMLNQRLGDSDFYHVFGVGCAKGKKPLIALLDEVHTYSGISGAQIAMLLRRWRYAADIRPHFVGLSATLADARKFFATLIGEPDSRIEEISPAPCELNRVGMEYLVALRGDPASRSSLLSTTIQAAMLMRRTLNAVDNNTAPQSSVYGSKEFVFTDDLDVTNRMFYNLRDAEGQDCWGNIDPIRHPNGSLANLRNPQLPDDRQRFRFGQSWQLCTWLGHSLQAGTSNLIIDRTSSQDKGVTTNADIIVATASLEVGFNDPEVNVVLQHKAPRDPAQFLQRKGRAGRRIEMRPWTVVALSDYGRDRLAWESFDLLFDPELPPRELPIRNRYVLRMQAVFAFFDWIASRLRTQDGTPKGSVYRDFSGPAEIMLKNEVRISNTKQRQQASALILEALLFNEEDYDDLKIYLSNALQQSEDIIEVLLWEPPRALMNAALPTLLRRLQTGWRIAGKEHNLDTYTRNNPLPEFIPGQLFGDLNLPEVTLRSPSQQRDSEEREDILPIVQAMREFAPGRVSRRFGIMNGYARHWVKPGDTTVTGPQRLQLSNIVSRFDELGTFERFETNKTPVPIRCVRPREIQLIVPEKRVMDSSNAFLVWNTQINPMVTGTPVDIPTPSRWNSILSGMEFFVHNLNNQLEVRRFATGSKATINFDNGQSNETTLLFVEDLHDTISETSDNPVGIGFAIDVDGLAIRFQVPKNLTSRLYENPSMLRCLRVSRFRDLISEDPTLQGVANVFQIHWLSQIYLSALTTHAINRGITLKDSWIESDTQPGLLNFHEVLGVIFQSLAISTSNNRNSDNDDSLDDVQQRLQSDLEHLLAENLVIRTLSRNAPTLWETPGEEWTPWLIRKFKTTLGTAILDGIQQVCIDLDAGDLLVDIESGPRPTNSIQKPDACEEIWITEKTVGGGGVIETFLTRYGEDPRRFFDLVENSLRASDYEIADQQLTLFLKWLTSSNESTIREKVTVYRNAASVNHQTHNAAFNVLLKTLTQRGLFTCHTVVAAIANRILRPGSNHETDTLLHRMISYWRQLEEKLNVEIDSRILAYLESANDFVDTVIQDTGDNAIEVNRRQWRFNTILSMLWPRGIVSRSARLTPYNPYDNLPETERELVQLFLDGTPRRVSVSSDDWHQQVCNCLVHKSEVILIAESGCLTEIRKALLDVMTMPIDAGFMLLHPKVNRVDRTENSIEIYLSLMEGIQ